jgi:hypothetical protein
VTVTYATAEGSASPGVDYTPASGVLTFAPGETTQTLAVSVLGDLLYEPDETFSVALSSPVYAVLGDATGVGTIYNDDGAPLLRISDTVVAAEGDDGPDASATFTVTLVGDTAQVVVVDYATGDGTASAGADYLAASGTLTWNPGELVKTVSITVYGDVLDEEDEDFYVHLSHPVHAALDNDRGMGVISDDDTAVLYIGSAVVVEGDAGAVSVAVPVTLTLPSSRPITVSYTTYDLDAAAGSDYAVMQGVLTLAPGEVSALIAPQVLGDVLDEEDEIFGLHLGKGADTVLGAEKGLVSILDDDDPPVVSIEDATAPEGDSGITDMAFDVALSAPSGRPVTVTCVAAPGDAAAGVDYEPISSTLAFEPGETAQTFTVSILGDVQYEGDETLTVTLSAPVHATVGDGLGVGTIIDDDALPQLWVADTKVVEGDAEMASALLTVTVSGAFDQIITVKYLTENGTALAGADYVTGTGSLSWLPGETIRTVAVAVQDDDLDEGEETFSLRLFEPVHALLGRARGIVTIMDDDGSGDGEALFLPLILRAE